MHPKFISPLLLLLLLGCGKSSSSDTRPGLTPDQKRAYEADVITPVEASPEMTFCLEELNRYRTDSGAPPLRLDGNLSAFAVKASEEFRNNRQPHGYFQSAFTGGKFPVGFCNAGGENQAMWGGDIKTAIKGILRAMMDEGPGGGHHDNIINPEFSRVGIGIVVEGGNIFFTNDFSGPCQ